MLPNRNKAQQFKKTLKKKKTLNITRNNNRIPSQQQWTDSNYRHISQPHA